MVIAIDFDNVLFEDNYPFVGEPIPDARDSVNRLYNDGHTIIINTCRENEPAENAILAMEAYGFKYHYFNENDPERVELYKNDSRKIGADVYIDDKSLPFLLTGIKWKLLLEMIEDFEDGQ
jgi:hypothetical protein